VTKFWELLSAIEDTNSRSDKQYYLGQLLDEVPWFEDMLKYTLDPDMVFNLIKIREPESGDEDLSKEAWLQWKNILDQLEARDISGLHAEDVVVNYLTGFQVKVQNLFLRIMRKDLKCGLGIKTVNAVREIISEFLVCLAEQHEDYPDIQYPVRIEPKIDGYRCVILREHGNVQLLSRSGKALDFPHLKAEFEAMPLDNTMFDSEIWHIDGFQAFQKVARSQRIDRSTLADKVFCSIFAQMDIAYFKRRMNPMYSSVGWPSEHKHIQQIETQIAYSEGDLYSFYAHYLAKGFEGIMIKEQGDYYEFKRTKRWLKLKPVKDADCKITGRYRGEKGTRLENTFGGFTVVHPNGVPTDVGGGYSDDERDRFWSQPIQDLLGLKVKVLFQNLTIAGVMRFPRFKEVVE